MATLLANLGPGDEVIMPSFTFCSTANAVVLRGAVPVFVDIRPDTLNIDEDAIEAAITPRTRAICVVHYAGVGAQMDAIMEIAERHGLIVIEDAAQAYLATFRGKPLGTFGAAGAISFHETKNLISGEGGALVVNDPAWAERAEIIWEKGTNRAAFARGEVARYTWVDVGSSFLPSELTAAFLLAQLEGGDDLTERRLAALAPVRRGARPARGCRRRDPAARAPGVFAQRAHLLRPRARCSGAGHRARAAARGECHGGDALRPAAFRARRAALRAHRRRLADHG